MPTYNISDTPSVNNYANNTNAILDINCGHLFCYACLTKLHHKKCPLCNLSYNRVIKLY